jgi:glycosyltransferase involved in cell wall biosynthesis
MRLALLTTFHERCGIAAYAEALVAELERHATVAVFSPERIAGDEGLGPQPPRLWNRNRAFGFEALRVRDAVLASRPDVVHLQINLSLYSSRFLFALVRLLARRVPVVATLHGRGGGSLGRRFKVARLALALSPADLIVHTADHARELGRARVHVIPHGIDPVTRWTREAARAELGLGADRPILAHFGFLVPDKGVAAVVRALPALRARHPELLYWVAGAVHQTEESRAHAADLARAAAELGLGDAVRFRSEFLPRERAVLELAAADWIVLNYETGGNQGASGAVRFALTSGRPVAVSGASIFDDVAPAVHRLRGELAPALEQLLVDRALAERTEHAGRAFVEAQSWARVAEAHLALYERIRSGRGGDR